MSETMSEALRFWKMEGCGNDFVVVYREDVPGTFGPEDAPQICDRRKGIGADGVLVIDLPARMTVWNADGSVAEMCGNGLRCVVRRLDEDGHWPAAAGVVHAGTRRLPARLDGDQITVGIAVPHQLDDAPIEVRGVHGIRVDMGNPHFVVFEDDQAAPLPDLLEWAPALEIDSRFPERTNVEHVDVGADGALKMRVWERGVGETQACGSGACAAAVVALSSGRTASSPVTVILPGGRLRVHWSLSGEALASLEGPARTTFQGNWRIEE